MNEETLLQREEKQESSRPAFGMAAGGGKVYTGDWETERLYRQPEKENRAGK